MDISYKKIINDLNNSSQNLTNTFFLQTCVKGDFELATELMTSRFLKFKPNIYHTNVTFALDLPELNLPAILLNPIMSASLLGNLEFVKLLMTPSENNLNPYKYSPEILLSSVINNHTHIIDYLLTQLSENDNDLNNNLINYNHILGVCAKREYMDVIEKMVKHEKILPTLNFNPTHKTSPLMMASQQGKLNMVKYLLNSDTLPEKCDLYHCDENFWNALNYATVTQQKEVIQYFIFECNMKINENDLKYFKRMFPEGLKMLNARDLYLNIKSTLAPEINKKNSLKKI